MVTSRNANGAIIHILFFVTYTKGMREYRGRPSRRGSAHLPTSSKKPYFADGAD